MQISRPQKYEHGRADPTPRLPWGGLDEGETTLPSLWLPLKVRELGWPQGPERGRAGPIPSSAWENWPCTLPGQHNQADSVGRHVGEWFGMGELAQAFGFSLLWGGLGEITMLLPRPLLPAAGGRAEMAPESRRASPPPTGSNSQETGSCTLPGHYSKDDPCGEGSSEPAPGCESRKADPAPCQSHY